MGQATETGSCQVAVCPQWFVKPFSFSLLIPQTPGSSGHNGQHVRQHVDKVEEVGREHAIKGIYVSDRMWRQSAVKRARVTSGRSGRCIVNVRSLVVKVWIKIKLFIF